MKRKWLVAFATLLFLFSWTSVFAGPQGQFGHGDDDIPELMRTRTTATPVKISDDLGVESLWNLIIGLDSEKEQELSKEQDAKRNAKPADRRLPVRSR